MPHERVPGVPDASAVLLMTTLSFAIGRIEGYLSAAEMWDGLTSENPLYGGRDK